MEDVGLESMFKVSSRETSDAVRTEISWVAADFGR
jgi:hypothetical protein